MTLKDSVCFGDVCRCFAFSACHLVRWSISYSVAQWYRIQEKWGVTIHFKEMVFHLNAQFSSVYERTAFWLNVEIIQNESPMYRLQKFHVVRWSFLTNNHLLIFFPFWYSWINLQILCMLIGQEKVPSR